MELNIKEELIYRKHNVNYTNIYPPSYYFLMVKNIDEIERKNKQVIISGDTIRQSIESCIPDHRGIVTFERQQEVRKSIKNVAKIEKVSVSDIPDYAIRFCKFRFAINGTYLLVTAHEYSNCFITRDINIISKEDYDDAVC